jgi:adenylate kinase family enzyme
MNKISILGVTASGKTTLANKISEILNIPVTHLDKIFWKEKGGIKQNLFVAELEH